MVFRILDRGVNRGVQLIFTRSFSTSPCVFVERQKQKGQQTETSIT